MTATEWRVTFGQRYRREHHPAFVNGFLSFEPHPDGWVTIFAASEARARRAAFAVLGHAWAFLYCGPFGDDWAVKFPLGELERVEAFGVRAVAS